MRTISQAAGRPRALLLGLFAPLLLAIGTCVAQAQGQVQELRYAFAVSSPSLITEPLYAAEKMAIWTSSASS